MAAPVIPAGTDGVWLSSEGASVTVHDVTLPPNVAANDILLAVVFMDGLPGAARYTWPGSWAELADVDIGTVASMAVGWLRAAGGETTVQVTTQNAERSTHFGVRITGAHTTSAPEISAVASGASTSPNPNSLTASWGAEDNLWIALYGVDSGEPSAYPLANNNSTTGTTPTSAAYGGLCSVGDTVATKDVGSFTNTTSDDWRAFTIVVRPAPAAATKPLPILHPLQAVQRAANWFRRHDGLFVPGRGIWVPVRAVV